MRQKFREACQKLLHQVVTDPLPPNRVASGWALGMFVGCAIPFGLQLVVSVPLALIFRVSKIGATVGTLVTNPVTIFFIYPAQTWVMYHLIFHNDQMGTLPSEWTWETVKVLSGPVIASFFLGGLALAILLTPPTYFIVKHLVVKYRALHKGKYHV